MATLAQLRAQVLIALARNDATAITVANAVINYAMIMTALTFMPSEMFSTTDQTITGGSDNIDFASLTVDDVVMSTFLLDIIKIYDSDNDYKLHFIPYENWDILIPSGLDYTKYWTLYGNKAYFKGTPSSNLNITISYSMFPTALSVDSDSVPFTHYDAYILSSAIGIAWAMFEEPESASMWSQISNLVGEPLALGAKAKDIIEGQKSIIENISTQVRG